LGEAPIRRLDLRDLSDPSPQHFPGALVYWASGLDPRIVRNYRYDGVFRDIDVALHATRVFLKTRPPTGMEEDKLSRLWGGIAKDVYSGDPVFAAVIDNWRHADYWGKTAGILYPINDDDIYKTQSMLAALDGKSGTDYPPPTAAPGIRAANPVLIVALAFAGVFGLITIYGGVELMNAPGGGDTTFDFLGLQFTTKQAGVASIALGAAAIILTFRKVLKTVVDLGKI
jgi:hypothetical protein